MGMAGLNWLLQGEADGLICKDTLHCVGENCAGPTFCELWWVLSLGLNMTSASVNTQ